MFVVAGDECQVTDFLDLVARTLNDRGVSWCRERSFTFTHLNPRDVRGALEQYEGELTEPPQFVTASLRQLSIQTIPFGISTEWS